MRVTLVINGQELHATILSQSNGMVELEYQGESYRFTGQISAAGRFTLDQEVAEHVWRRQAGNIHKQQRSTQLQLAGLDFTVQEAGKAGAADQGNALSPVAPMPGLVRKIHVKKGEKVKAGQVVAVLEAMKLQLDLHAGGDGVVSDIHFKAGDMVGEGAAIISIDAKG